jgi:dienelactone hydrolase
MKSNLKTALFAGLALSSLSHAALVRKTVEYQVSLTGDTAKIGSLTGDTAKIGSPAGDTAKNAAKTTLSGVLIFDSEALGEQPGLVLVPNWMGINESNLMQAELVANMGYVVFVADMYGKNVRPKTADEAGKAAGAVKSDRALMRARAQAALANLLNASKTYNAALDTSHIGAIGFCFGGTSALELARSGAKIGGVVSFHGGLDAPTSYDVSKVHAAFLALHGADDPYVPAADVAGFQTEMRSNKFDWELVSYGGAVHSFTDVDAKAKGQADYNPKVAGRAYARMQQFFNELFGFH